MEGRKRSKSVTIVEEGTDKKDLWAIEARAEQNFKDITDKILSRKGSLFKHLEEPAIDSGRTKNKQNSVKLMNIR